MIFLSSLLSWLFARFGGPVSGLHNDRWLTTWVVAVDDAVGELFGKKIAFAFMVLGPSFLLALVIGLIGGWFFQLVELLISVAVLLYCFTRLDYQGLDMRYQNTLSRHDQKGMQLVADEIGVVAEGELIEQHEAIRKKILYIGYDRWFSAICWFLLLGPAGALFYRLVSMIAEAGINDDPTGEASTLNNADDRALQSDEDNVPFLAVSLLGWLDWAPARLWCFLFAVAGRFGTAFSVLTEHIGKAEQTSLLIDRVALAADESDATVVARHDFDSDFNYDAAEQQMIQLSELNDRTMVVALVCVCLLVIIF